MENVSDNEKLILKQIKSYNDSQNQIRNLIESDIGLDEPINLNLNLVNDEWLDQWKKYTCFDDIKFKKTLNIKNLKEIRTRKNADQFILSPNNTKKLFINDFKNKNEPINLGAYFHFLTEDCYKTLCGNNNNNNMNIQFKCEITLGKIMKKYLDKIIILYKNENKLNLIFLVFDDNNKAQIEEIYDQLKAIDMIEFLFSFGIEPNCEKKEICINDISFTFINKSYSYIQSEEEVFKKVVSCLIKEEYFLFPNYSSGGIKNLILYLINENWLSYFKKCLKYLDILKSTGISAIGQTQAINKILEAYKINPSSLEKEIINEENHMYYFLLEKNSGNYFKLYSDYTLITEDLWFNLTKLFPWDIEIKLKVFFINKHIIIKYNENDFEIYELVNNIKKNNLFFHINLINGTEQIINEMKNLSINGFYNKYNINIFQETQTYFILENNDNIFGFAININAAKNNFDEFNLMIQEQLGKINLNKGYNAKNDNTHILNKIKAMNNNNINFSNCNINNKNNNNMFNINNINNQNINNNIDNINNQFMNMNLNAKNMNIMNNNYNDQSETKKIFNNPNFKISSLELTEYITEENIENSINEQSETSLNINLNAYQQNIFQADHLKTITEDKNNICEGINNNMNNVMNNINDFHPNMNDINNNQYPIRKTNTFDISNNQINLQSGFDQSNQNNNLLNRNKTMPQNIINQEDDILKCIILCLSNCKIFFDNIINYNLNQPNKPIMKLLRYIFQNNIYNPIIQQLKDNLNKTSNQFINYQEPNNVFKFLLESINNEIGSFNFGQNNIIPQNINLNNKYDVYDEFLKKIYSPMNNTFISKNFFGIKEIITKCFFCHNEVSNFEIFKYIEFSLEEIAPYTINKLREIIQSNTNKENNKNFFEIVNDNVINLNSCFDYYSNKAPQMNKFFSCTKCKNQIDNSNEKNVLRKLPNIFCILIKNSNNYKISVKLEEVLNLDNYSKLANKKNYELISAIIKSKEDGKFYSLIKSRINQTWILHLDVNNKKNFNIQNAQNRIIPFLLIYKTKN